MPLSGLTTCAKSIQYDPLKAWGDTARPFARLGGFLSMNYEPTSLFDLPAIWSGVGGAPTGLAPATAPSRPTSGPFDYPAVLPVMWDEDEEEEDDDEDDEDDEFFDDESEFEEEGEDDEANGDDDADLDEDEEDDEDEEEAV
jgi:hypothetical protein